MENTPQSSGVLRRVWQWLPAAGAVLIVAGFALALVNARFTVASTSLSLAGLALFMTLFVRVELAYLRYYLHLGLYSLIVLGICATAYLFGRTHNFQFDFSSNKVNTLSDETVNYMKGLAADVTVTVFSDEAPGVERMLKRYAALSPHLKYAIHDAVKDPETTQGYPAGVLNGDIFVKCGGRQDKLNAREMEGASLERFFTRAIYRVSRDSKIVVYFLSGHGEIDFEPSTTNKPGETVKPSLARFRDALAQRAIETRQLDLGQAEKVPDDASLVVLAGPQIDLFENEKNKLDAYLKDNGKLMVLLHVMIGQGRTAKLDMLDALLEKQGVMVSQQIILDGMSEQLGGRAFFPMIDMYNGGHAITKNMPQGQRSQLPGMCLMLYPDPERKDQQFIPLLASSKTSWAESLGLVLSKIQNKLPVKPEKGEEVGPKVLALAVQPAPPPAMPGLPPLKPKDGAQLVVFGSSVFIQDAYTARLPAAADLMLNCVKWLTDQTGAIEVPDRMPGATPIKLDDSQSRVIFVFSVLFLPALIFFGGVSYSILRRRN